MKKFDRVDRVRIVFGDNGGRFTTPVSGLPGFGPVWHAHFDAVGELCPIYAFTCPYAPADRDFSLFFPQ